MTSILTFIIIGLLFILFQVIMLMKYKSQPVLRRLDHDECMGILNETMKREFNLRYKLEYELKDLTMIYNFKKDLNELVQSTLTGLSLSFVAELEFFYTKKYVIQYVTKTLELMLMSFTQEKKIKTM